MRALILPLAIISSVALAGPLNDTGIDFCRDHATGVDTPVTASTTCTPTQGGQDARYGRDPAAQRGAMTKVGGGSKGFDFTKVCNSGQLAGQGSCPANPALGSNPTDWACTYDNTTGLTWEVKTTSGLRNYNHTYSWYDSANNYGGNAGTASGGSCQTTGRCDTEKFVADVNATNLCGHADWRMPTVDELFNIADLGRINSTIDPTYFTNTPSSNFWSGSPYAVYSGYAWNVYFVNGIADYNLRNSTFNVRLVRGQ